MCKLCDEGKPQNQGEMLSASAAPPSGGVVSLMDRTNVETVIVAGRERKLHGKLLEVDVAALRNRIEASRDYLFTKTGFERDLLRAA